jgi:hypothetical protein
MTLNLAALGEFHELQSGGLAATLEDVSDISGRHDRLVGVLEGGENTLAGNCLDVFSLLIPLSISTTHDYWHTTIGDKAFPLAIQQQARGLLTSRSLVSRVFIGETLYITSIC